LKWEDRENTDTRTGWVAPRADKLGRQGRKSNSRADRPNSQEHFTGDVNYNQRQRASSETSSVGGAPGEGQKESAQGTGSRRENGLSSRRSTGRRPLHGGAPQEIKPSSDSRHAHRDRSPRLRTAAHTAFPSVEENSEQFARCSCYTGQQGRENQS
jgi:hypothetical protein